MHAGSHIILDNAPSVDGAKVAIERHFAIQSLSSMTGLTIICLLGPDTGLDAPLQSRIPCKGPVTKHGGSGLPINAELVDLQI